jgi:hypothetical protein
MSASLGSVGKIRSVHPQMRHRAVHTLRDLIFIGVFSSVYFHWRPDGGAHGYHALAFSLLEYALSGIRFARVIRQYPGAGPANIVA